MSNSLIDQPGEDAFQEIADQLETLAEELRRKALRGRRLDDVARTGETLRDHAATLDRLTLQKSETSYRSIR